MMKKNKMINNIVLASYSRLQEESTEIVRETLCIDCPEFSKKCESFPCIMAEISIKDQMSDEAERIASLN